MHTPILVGEHALQLLGVERLDFDLERVQAFLRARWPLNGLPIELARDRAVGCVVPVKFACRWCGCCFGREAQSRVRVPRKEHQRAQEGADQMDRVGGPHDDGT